MRWYGEGRYAKDKASEEERQTGYIGGDMQRQQAIVCL
jgi:hypothetical protein